MTSEGCLLAPWLPRGRGAVSCSVVSCHTAEAVAPVGQWLSQRAFPFTVRRPEPRAEGGQGRLLLRPLSWRHLAFPRGSVS